MSSASRPITTQLIGAVAAANADRLGLGDPSSNPAETRSIDTATGWDSYEVWRRFIKDARDRRQRHRD